MNYMHKQQTRWSYTLPNDPIHYPLTPGFVYNSEVSVKHVNKDKYIPVYSILAKSTDVTSEINRPVKLHLSWIVNYICQFLSL